MLNRLVMIYLDGCVYGGLIFCGFGETLPQAESVGYVCAKNAEGQA
ncbi:hypothetical protein KAR91_28045 [Candidatus Pacearchaeota archaeon]|nr:hypothetical protein [Candidatus Pacearchaeota archaeon]